MNSIGNINLTCIQVDDENAVYPECGGFPVVGWCKDEWSSYSENCELGLTALENFNFELHPNPATEKLYINSANTTTNLKIQILNIEGKLLSTQKFESTSQTSIDISQLNGGLYFLTIEDQNGNTTAKKFIKQ
jgi:hypothetical protein